MEKKHFVKIVKSWVTVLFKIDTFNFTMYISTILACPLILS